MSLLEMIRAPRQGIGEIASYLDGLGGQERWEQLRDLNRDSQRALYEKAAGSDVMTLGDLVGDAREREEVIHEGRNTLPFPGPLRHFQKRFCRAGDTSGVLYGYNEGVARRFIGPGYFVARETAGRPQWEARGGVVVDYFEVPSGEVAPSWPAVVDNDVGLQRFVFRHTRDYLRRVSRTVSIGVAYKRERPLDHYFVLCRSL